MKTNIENSDLAKFAEALGKSAGDIKDWYTIGLWNQCHGSFKNGEMVTEGCSDPHIKYWFDPKKEFNLGDIPVDELYSDKLKNALNTYHKASNALYYIFIIAFVTTIVEILAGIGAIFSRWGSFFTTLVSLVSHILMFLKKEMAMSFMLLTSSQSGCRRLHHCSRRLRLRHVPDHQRRNQP